MAGSRMDIGFQGFRKTLELSIMFGWPIQRSECGSCGMCMACLNGYQRASPSRLGPDDLPCSLVAPSVTPSGRQPPAEALKRVEWQREN